jgi:hypothetical protein
LLQFEADVEGLFQRDRAARPDVKHTERLLEPAPSVGQRRPRECLESCLPEIKHRLLPQLPSEGVMTEPLDLLSETILVEHLDLFDDARVKITAPLVQEAAVRNLVRERVLEGEGGIREEALLVEELG